MIFNIKIRKESNIEKLREEVIRLIDESKETVYKIVFYSDEDVQRIMERISKRWEEAGCQGRPIDYATPEELKILHKVAKRVTSKTPAELIAEYRELLMGQEL